jgi:hypothetical protein
MRRTSRTGPSWIQTLTSLCQTQHQKRLDDFMSNL